MRVLENLGALLLGLVLAAGLAEGFARLVGAGAPAELGPAFDREARYLHAAPSRRPIYSMSDEEPLRIAVIGDSFTVGQGNQSYDAFPARLEHLANLNDGVRPVRVTAYAQKGMSTADERRFLFTAIQEGADLLVLAVFLNDTEDPRDPQIRAWKERLRPRAPSGWRLRLLKRSRALAWLYQRWELARCHRAQIAFTEYCFDPAYRGWGRFKDAVARFGEVSREQGVPLAAVVFPPMAHLDAETYPHHYAHDLIEAELAANEIPFLDLRPLFLGKDPQRMAVYPGIDAHPSEIGHRLAAHEIFRFLIRGGFLAKAYIPDRFDVELRSDWLRQVRQMRSVAFVDEVEDAPVEKEYPARSKRKRRRGPPPAADPEPGSEPGRPSGETSSDGS